MECTRVRELISEYIDETLDAEVRAAVEEHVSACMGCKEELTKVSALVDELGSLGPVKAPGDLLEKIHERMDLGYGFHRIVRKLFVPFRIKIPLEFAGAVVVAILVVAVFLNIQQTEEEIAKIPTVSTQERDVLKPPVDHLEQALKQEAKMAAPVLEKSLEMRSGLQDVMVARKPMETPMKSAVEKEYEPPSVAHDKARVPVRKRETHLTAPVLGKSHEIQSRIEDVGLDRKSMETPMKSAVKEEYKPSPSAPGKARVRVSRLEAKMAAPVLEESEEMRSGIDEMLVVQKSPEVPMKPAVTKVVEPPPAVSEKPKAGESVRARKPIELVLVIKRELIDKTPRSHMAMQLEIRKQIDVPDEEEVRTPPPSSHEEAATRQAESLIHLIRLANGKVLDVKYDRQTGRFYYFHVEIHTDQYESFTQGLDRLGTLRTTPPDLTEKDRETVHIRINLESPE